MARKRKKRAGKAGLSPGSLVHIGEQKVEQVEIFLTDYSHSVLEEKKIINVQDLRPYITSSSCSWINVVGLHDVSVIGQFGELLNIHPLVLEDILNIHQRPKVDQYPDYMFLVLKMIHQSKETGQIITEQLSVLLGESYLLTFQEQGADVFDPVRERIRQGRPRIRSAGVDYLAYALIDAIVDHYFVVLEWLDEKLESLDGQVTENPDPAVLRELHDTKKDILSLRKSIWPLREVVGAIARGEPKQIHESTRVFLRDVYDHTIQVIDTIESQRDSLSSLLDLYLSMVSNRMNEVMKVLTIIATIFIPLTFIAGVYGMNFKYMPELDYHYGYPLVWLVMILMVCGMFYYFKKKEWL